nr:hypothetical protein [Salinibacter ruber]
MIPATYTYLTSEDAGPALVSDGGAGGDGLPEEGMAPQQQGAPSG